MKLRLGWLPLLGILAAAGVVSCDSGSVLTSVLPTATEPPLPPTVKVPSDAETLLARVQDDLAVRLGVGADQIRLVTLEAKSWPDGSLGCPEPGHSYVQVITPGYRIVLEAEGQEYAYHAGGEVFVLCESAGAAIPPSTPSPTPPPTIARSTIPLPTATATTPSATESHAPTPEAPALRTAVTDPVLARWIEEAKADLARRLGRSPGNISVSMARPVQWRDSSLGCPQPGFAYLTVITPGYQIRLNADGQIYEYHADRRQLVYCPNPQEPLP